MEGDQYRIIMASMYFSTAQTKLPGFEITAIAGSGVSMRGIK